LALDAVGDWLSGFPVLAFECDAAGELRAVTAYWTELTGQGVEAALGAGWKQFLDGERFTADVAEQADALRRGETVRQALKVRHREGAWCWLSAVIRPVLRDGALVGLDGLARLEPGGDEVASVRLERAEREVERLDTLLSAWPDLILVASRDGVYLSYRVSDPGSLYVTPEKFLGKRMEETLPPEVARLSREALEHVLASGQPKEFSYELEVPLGLRSFEARVLPTRAGEVLYAIRDITEVRRRQEELVSAREDALERNRLKTRFLANVSHEIRTPLNSILGVTQLLKQHALPGEVSEYVDVLQGAGESLLAIVDDVLDLSRIEANKLELEPRPFDLEQLVNETSKSFLALVQKKGLSLVIDVSPSAKGPVKGDPARIRQIVGNLVSNAVKFTDEGSVRVGVRRLDPERVRISVSDTGPGISPEHHERIFEAFEQADGLVRRRFGGTGLGLAITRQLARLMGGEVTVTSQLEHGATFQLEIPLPPVVIGAAVTRSRVTPPPRPLRVLLAEDDPVNASMTAALLRKLGHKVEVVHDGAACVAAAARGELDLVLMDVQMPVLDGLQATAEIRHAEKGTTRHMPIVALTANAMKGDDIRCLSAGMDAYLPKPVTVGALTDLLLWFGGREG
jgi:signal transduction histidine kinase/CheY-like chemotaxis protein